MPHGARFVDEIAELVGVAHVVRHHRAEELDRVIRLQIRGLIGDDGVGGGVGFVEAVTGEFFQQIENLIGLGCGNVVLLPRNLSRRSRAASAISSTFFLPMARRSKSAPPSV